MSRHECKYYNRDSEGMLRCVECSEPSARDRMYPGESYLMEVKMDKTEIEDKAVHKVEDKSAVKDIFPPESKRIKKKHKKR